MTKDEMKHWIDAASYEDLLRRWRCGAIGDPLFQGEIGRYYTLAMAKKKADLSHADQVRISKDIG